MLRAMRSWALFALIAPIWLLSAVASAAGPARPASSPTALSYEISISGEYQRLSVLKGESNHGTTHVEFAWQLHPTAAARLVRSGSDYVISGSDLRLKGSTVKYELDQVFEQRTPDGKTCTAHTTEHLRYKEEMQGSLGGRLYGGLRFSSVLAIPPVRQQTEATCGDTVTTTARKSHALYAIVTPRDPELQRALDHASPGQVQFGSSFQVQLKTSNKTVNPSSRLEESWEYTYNFRPARG